MKALFPAWIRFALLVLPAAAAQSESASLGPISIKSARLQEDIQQLPASGTVIELDRNDEARQGLGIDEVLTTVPGVFTQNRYNQAQDLRLSIRGFGARANFGIRGVRILADGIPATTPDGQSNVDDIDLASLQRIEVLRGPAGSLYGASAGGVLTLESKAPPDAPTALLRGSAGSYATQQYRLEAGARNDVMGALISVGDERSDGYRDQSASERRLANVRVDKTTANSTDVTFTAAVLDAPLAQDPGGLTAAEVADNPRQAAPLNLRFDAGEEVRQWRAGIHSRTPLAGESELRARAYFVERDFDSLLPFTAIELDRAYGGGGLEYVRDDRWFARPARWLVGVDVDRQDDDRRRRDNEDGHVGAVTADQRERVDSRGVFFLAQQTVAERLRLDAGLRYDHLQMDVDDRFLSDGDDSGAVRYAQWSPSLALLVESSASTQWYARIATGFETPTTTELTPADGSGGLNPALRPETSINYELGGRFAPRPAVRVEGALYQIDIDDQLVPFEIPTSPGRFAFTNAGESRNRGAELALDLGGRLGWGARLAYTWQDLRFVSFTDANGRALDNNHVPGTPRQLLGFVLRYRHEAGLTASMDSRYVDDFFADNANTVRVDSSWVADARLGYEQSRGQWSWGLFGGVNNVNDEHYNNNVRINASGGRYFEPAPPRNAYAGLHIRRRW